MMETVNWIRAKAIPLATVEAGNGFADLEPLRLARSLWIHTSDCAVLPASHPNRALPDRDRGRVVTDAHAP